jgi:hypothetical protein
MNVAKGDKAIIIDGPSKGIVVIVGDYIPPESEVSVCGVNAFVDDAPYWWVRSQSKPIELFCGALVRLGNHAIKLPQKMTTLQVMDAPMEDSLLRKLVDGENDELVKDKELELT